MLCTFFLHLILFMQYQNNHQVLQQEMDGLLKYEIDMFRETCNALSSGRRFPLFWNNLLIESLALHTRILIDFFYCDDKDHDDDVIAQDLLPSHISWTALRPQLPEVLGQAKIKANKQLAHLSATRIMLERQGQKGWRVLDIFNEINKIIECFEDAKNR